MDRHGLAGLFGAIVQMAYLPKVAIAARGPLQLVPLDVGSGWAVPPAPYL